MIPAAAYLRCSTDKQEDSPETQLGILMEFASCEGYKIVAVYSDEAVSGGKSITTRNGFKNLLAERKPKGFDTVLLVRLDRLSRNMLDFMQFEEAAHKHKLKIVYATERYTEDSSGWLLKHINVLFAHHSRTLTGERTKEKCRQLAAHGIWPSGYPPLGFAYDKKTKILSVDEARGSDAVAVFKTFIESNGNKSLTASRLNSRGIRTAKGNLWRDDGVTFLVTNPIYRGRIHYADIDLQSDNVPIVVPPELVTHADLLLGTKRRRQARKSPNVYTYTSVLTCAQCGCGYKVHEARNRYEMYICRGKAESGICRDSKRLSSNWLNKLVPIGLTKALEAHLSKFDISKDDQPERNNDNRIRSLRECKKRKQEMYACGIIETIDELKSQLAEIDKEIAELSTAPQITPFNREDLIELSVHIKDYWGRMSTDERRSLLLTMCPEIYVHSSEPRWIRLETRLSIDSITIDESDL
ncbi:MAG: recombinase family protein [Armatimonadota bacterium]